MPQFIRQQYRLYPTKNQAQILDQWIGASRWIWNYMLSQNITKYKEEQKFVFVYEMNNQLPELKKQPETEWLKLVPSQAIQQKCQTLDTALKRSFKKTSGFPRFKSRKTDTSGITLPQGYKFHGNRINFPKLKGVKVKKHREVDGKQGACTIIKDRVGDYFVSILYEINEFAPPVDQIYSSIGIDVGLKEFAITSDAEIIENHKFFRRSAKKLTKLQRIHSKRKKQSNNKEKSRIKLSKAHRKITRQRTDFIKKTSLAITKQNDVICVENLNVKGMMANHKLARAIADVSWSSFISELQWQAIKHQSHLVKIDRFFPSSKTCSSCGEKKLDLTLKDRTFVCPSCGYEIDRDLNAAINIHNEGMRMFRNTVGTTEIHACGDMIQDTDSAQEAR